jgi:hypothetical protein
MQHEEAVVDKRKKNEEVGECRPLLGLQLSQRKHNINIHTGKMVTGGGTVEPERSLEGQQFTKLGRKFQHD